jgi:DNA-binding response OmpR family regulator
MREVSYLLHRSVSATSRSDPGSNVVDVYVGYLRRKINFEGLAPMILTVRGAGYRLEAP